MGKEWHFDSRRRKFTKKDVSGGENESMLDRWIVFSSIPRVSNKGLGG